MPEDQKRRQSIKHMPNNNMQQIKKAMKKGVVDKTIQQFYKNKKVLMEIQNNPKGPKMTESSLATKEILTELIMKNS